MSTATSTGSGRLSSKGPYLYITQCYREEYLAIVFLFIYLNFFMFKHSIVIYLPWDDIEKKSDIICVNWNILRIFVKDFLQK